MQWFCRPPHAVGGSAVLQVLKGRAMRNGISGGDARRRPGRRLTALIAAIVVSGSLVATSAGTAAAGTASGSRTSTAFTAGSKAAATGSNAATANSSASSSTTSSGGAAVAQPFTGTGCHTYDYWSGAHVCVTVYGSGLNVQSVTGETDGPDTDWGKIYDTAGVITIWGHPTNHYLSISWASGGGVWLANGDNLCFSDTTLGQTACITIRL
jgi:hypothetical protein